MPRARREENPVERAVRTLGGAYEAARIGRTTPTTIYRAEKEGVLRLAVPCLCIARALARRGEGDEVELAWKLAGQPED